MIRDRPRRRQRRGVGGGIRAGVVGILAAALVASPLLGVGVLADETRPSRRDVRTLSDAQVTALAALEPAPWDAVDSGHMKHLLVERVSGTEGNKAVQAYISSVFTNLGWHEERDTFTEATPYGDVEFTNLVYTFDPSAPRRLSLSAHFDSKYWPDGGGFIGATDSAAPVGFLIDVAEALTPLLRARKERVEAGNPLLTAHLDEDEAADTTLQIVLFDGEEAFKHWTATDSVYGSRHLAAKWDEEYLDLDAGRAGAGAGATRKPRRMDPATTVLDSIDVLVLLDLLGAPGPQFTSHYRDTDWLYALLMGADARLRAAGLVNATGTATPSSGNDEWFSPYAGNPGGLDDDHRPFLQRGVPILHLIPTPFPAVWHTIHDDKTALDLNTCRRWAAAMRLMTAEYLHLAPDDVSPAKEERSGDTTYRSDELVRHP